MKWTDLINLIGSEASGNIDENGFLLPETKLMRTVYANKKSVGYAEFFESQQEGFKTILKFDIYTAEYNGEEIMEHKNKRYKVLRTYESKNGEFTELTVSDLKERSGMHG